MTAAAVCPPIRRGSGPRVGWHFLGLLLPLTWLTGCAAEPIVAPAHPIRPAMAAVHLMGTVTVENRCPLLNDGSGSLLPIWPEGVNVSGGMLRMRDAPVTRIGDVVEVGGRWVSLADVADDLLAPLPAGCTGRGRVFWVEQFEFGAGAAPEPRRV